eukprot:3937815-Rhodomonas_salina.2
MSAADTACADQHTDFTVGHLLGRGSAGGVKLALHRPTNVYYALKVNLLPPAPDSTSASF